MKNYTLYLDDLRTPVQHFDVVARSYNEALSCIQTNGMPCFISFDHDLGEDEAGKLLKSGYDLAKWIVNADALQEYPLPENFSYKVHSQNPVGKKNIESLLNRYLQIKE